MIRNWQGLLSATLAVGAAPAFAGFTGIGGSGEADILTNLNTIYGAPLSKTIVADGLDFKSTDDVLFFERIEDHVGADVLDPGETNNLITNGGKDQEWTDGVASFEFRLRIAAFKQSFGIDLDSAGGNVSPEMDIVIFNSDDDGIVNPSIFTLDDDGVTTPTEEGLSVDGDFRWTRAGRGGNVFANPQSSRASLNPEAGINENADHLITYRVTGLPDQGEFTVWLLMWDDQDQTVGDPVDRDFNDQWVELRAIPAPGAVLLAIMGAGVITQIRRRKENNV